MLTYKDTVKEICSDICLSSNVSVDSDKKFCCLNLKAIVSTVVCSYTKIKTESTWSSERKNL